MGLAMQLLSLLCVSVKAQPGRRLKRREELFELTVSEGLVCGHLASCAQAEEHAGGGRILSLHGRWEIETHRKVLEARYNSR